MFFSLPLSSSKINKNVSLSKDEKKIVLQKIYLKDFLKYQFGQKSVASFMG